MIINRTLLKSVIPISVLFVVLSFNLLEAKQNSASIPAPSKGTLTVEKVEAQLKKFEEKSGLENGTRGAAIKFYQEALEYLRLADEWAAKSADFEKTIREAPATLKSLQSTLAKQQVEPKLDIPAGASLQDMEYQLSQYEAQLKIAQDKVAALDEERKWRAKRRGEIPNSIAATKQNIDKIDKEIRAASPPDEPEELSAAKGVLAQAKNKALENEVASSQKEIENYIARGELLTARQDQATRELSSIETLVKLWQGVVNEHRRVEIETSAREAELARQNVARSYPIAQKLAEENSLWAERRINNQIADKIQQATKRYDEISKRLTRLSADFKSITSKVHAAGLTHAVGLLLRRQLADLPNLRKYQRSVATRQSEISAIQLQLIELGEERSKLSDIESLANSMLDDTDSSISGPERKEMETIVRDLLQIRRGYVDSLISDYNTYFVKLVDIDAEERRLIVETRTFAEYISRHVFWILSASPPRLSDVAKGWQAFYWFIWVENWAAVTQSLKVAVWSHPVFSLAGLLIFVGLLLLRPRIRAKIIEEGDAALKSHSYYFLPTAIALALTAVLSIVRPFPVWFLGRLLGSAHNASDFVLSLSFGMETVAVTYLTIEIFRQISIPKGLAKAHFEWPSKILEQIRRQLIWFIPLALAVIFIFSVLEKGGEDAWQNSLGRFVFITGQMLLAVFIRKVFCPAGTAFQETRAYSSNSWAGRMWVHLYPVLLGLPIALTTLSLFGYHYTAIQLTKRLMISFWLFFALMIVNALALRWLLLSKRKLGIQQARVRRKTDSSVIDTPQGDLSISRTEEEKIDLTGISEQTRILLRGGVRVAILAGLWFVWKDVLPALGILENIKLWSTTVTSTVMVPGSEDALISRTVELMVPVTLADLLLASLILVVTFVSSKNIPGLLEMTVLQRLPLAHGERYAIGSISRYSITIIGISVAFGVMGIGWAKVQWLAAAITVGLGFGLQEIFANFVSGLILLFERPIRIDDIVTVGDVEGRVTQINIRATTILDWNRKELVVPNKEFVTGKFINWTLSDSITRIVVPVGIAYGSDTELARNLLLKVAKECSFVLSDPSPKAIFRNFGASSLDFELRVFIPTLDNWQDAMHEVHTGIDREFRKAGIEIAFPQMDIHVRSIKDSLSVIKKQSPGEDAR